MLATSASPKSRLLLLAGFYGMFAWAVASLGLRAHGQSLVGGHVTPSLFEIRPGDPPPGIHEPDENALIFYGGFGVDSNTAGNAIPGGTALGIPSLVSASLVDTTRASEAPVSRFKQQALQRAGVASGWLGATNNQDLSSTFLDASIRLGVPLGSMDNLLGITPNFRVDWIDAAPTIDVPEELYETGIEFFYLRKCNDRWKLLGMVRPSVRSDFTTSQDALKLFALAAAVWDYIPQRLSITLGAVYLGRSDLPALPAVGLIWTPDATRRFELQFPRSRILKRLAKDGAQSELWANVTLGIGGNTWAVTRSNGDKDEIAMRDLRLTSGVERIVSGGGGWFVEAGVAFDRRIEFLSDQSATSLSEGLFLSGGWAY